MIFDQLERTLLHVVVFFSNSPNVHVAYQQVPNDKRKTNNNNNKEKKEKQKYFPFPWTSVESESLRSVLRRDSGLFFFIPRSRQDEK